MSDSENINEIVMFGNQSPAKAGGEGVTEAATPAAVPEQRETQAESHPAGPARDESGKFKAAEPAKEPAAATGTETRAEHETAQRGQMAALLAERAKRQQLEARLAELEARAQPGTQQQETDFYADPAKAIDERVASALAPFRQTFLSQSIEIASKAHEDFDEAIKHFMDAADQNPELRSMFLSHENPGEFAHFIGSTTPAYRQSASQKHAATLSAKDAEIATLKSRVAELEQGQKAVAGLPESLNRVPSGAVPARESNDLDARNIVRFKG